ncbi:MAG: ABC transporter substrate-binding protein [Pseudomonadota bacterium]|nr:ABC transporter substrate-binding protein [Pseudomonadota bacterium]
MIAKEMVKEGTFVDMTFSSILPSLNTHSIDAAIATITATELRTNNFDFSDPYYFESLSIISPQTSQLLSKDALTYKTIATQLGSTMEIWLKTNMQNVNIVAMDTNIQAIEALKAGHVDGVLVDTAQALEFCKQNIGLTHAFIAKSDSGYCIALPKGSSLVEPINQAIATLKDKGEIAKLEKKYLGVSS